VHAADELKVEFDLAVPLSSPQGTWLHVTPCTCMRAMVVSIHAMWHYMRFGGHRGLQLPRQTLPLYTIIWHTTP
jgi:hypothetical protein